MNSSEKVQNVLNVHPDLVCLVNMKLSASHKAEVSGRVDVDASQDSAGFFLTYVAVDSRLIWLSSTRTQWSEEKTPSLVFYTCSWRKKMLNIELNVSHTFAGLLNKHLA